MKPESLTAKIDEELGCGLLEELAGENLSAGRLASAIHRMGWWVGLQHAEDRAAFGFHTVMDYDEYLRSDRWKTIRRLKIDEAEGRCQLCNGEPPLHVHHRTYERRGEERLTDLIALCVACHEKFHDKEPV